MKRRSRELSSQMAAKILKHERAEKLENRQRTYPATISPYFLEVDRANVPLRRAVVLSGPRSFSPLLCALPPPFCVGAIYVIQFSSCSSSHRLASGSRSNQEFLRF